MINIRHALIHWQIDDRSPCGAVQNIRTSVDVQSNPREWITNAMVAIFGVDTKMVGVIPARIALQYAVDEAIKNECDVADVDVLIAASEQKAIAFVTAESNQHHWIGVQRSQLATTSGVVSGVVQRPTSQTASNNASPKRGTKQVRARELYLIHVVNAVTPLTNQEFVALLMSDPVTQMTKSGATTYRYNLMKEFATT